MSLYALAENLGKTVDELLTGEKRPLSNEEFMHWIVFSKRRAEEQEKQQKTGGRSSNTSQRPRTLGDTHNA